MTTREAFEIITVSLTIVATITSGVIGVVRGIRSVAKTELGPAISGLSANVLSLDGTVRGMAHEVEKLRTTVGAELLELRRNDENMHGRLVRLETLSEVSGDHDS